jgi:hypothetical protein
VIVLLDYNSLMVKTWTGEEKPVKKMTFFAEKDNKGEVFYKIEGQNNKDSFMIQYYYNKEQGLNEYIELLDILVNSQVKNLLEL